jgi:hypothetical protein
MHSEMKTNFVFGLLLLHSFVIQHQVLVPENVSAADLRPVMFCSHLDRNFKLFISLKKNSLFTAALHVVPCAYNSLKKSLLARLIMKCEREIQNTVM